MTAPLCFLRAHRVRFRCDGVLTVSGYGRRNIAEDAVNMSTKRSKKVKKRQKALQRRRQQPTNKHRLFSQIPPGSADQLAMTTTGEIMQPIRLHYDVFDSEQLRATFSTLNCIDYDASQRRWVWLYTDEAMILVFKARRVPDNVVLGEFVLKGTKEVVLNLRSFERAIKALNFFDQYIPRSVARVTAVTVSNRLLSFSEASSLRSLHQYFERAKVVAKDPDSLMQTLEDMTSRIPDAQKRLGVVMQYIEDTAKQPMPAMERFPLNYYEEGIRSVEAFLSSHKVIAMQHWRGNTDYTPHDFVQDMLRDGAIPTETPDT